MHQSAQKPTTWTSYHRHTLDVFFLTFCFFLCRWTQPSLANTVLSTDCDGKWSENAYIFPSGSASIGAQGGATGRATRTLGRLSSLGVLASLGQYTAAVKYTDQFLPQHNQYQVPYWLSQPVPSTTYMYAYLCSPNKYQVAFFIRVSIRLSANSSRNNTLHLLVATYGINSSFIVLMHSLICLSSCPFAFAAAICSYCQQLRLLWYVFLCHLHPTPSRNSFVFFRLVFFS